MEVLLEFKCLLDPVPCKMWKSFVGDISRTALGVGGTGQNSVFCCCSFYGLSFGLL